MDIGQELKVVVNEIAKAENLSKAFVRANLPGRTFLNQRIEIYNHIERASEAGLAKMMLLSCTDNLSSAIAQGRETMWNIRTVLEMDLKPYNVVKIS